jgi:hypothetical protein
MIAVEGSSGCHGSVRGGSADCERNGSHLVPSPPGPGLHDKGVVIGPVVGNPKNYHNQVNFFFPSVIVPSSVE